MGTTFDPFVTTIPLTFAREAALQPSLAGPLLNQNYGENFKETILSFKEL